MEVASVAVEPLKTKGPIRAWLTAARCRFIFGLVLLFNFALQWRFLTHHCPIDLSGDEAQYWDWSRHLDLSYYSKGPLIAYLIRGSCAVLGDTVPGVRFPVLLLAIGTSICTYWLTLKFFKSDRLALGAFLLGGIVPMYAAGSVLMTIDPPFFFFWALASCLIVKAVWDGMRWAWIGTGVVVGLGFLTKYAMFLWLPMVLLFLLTDRASHRWLRTVWPWLMIAVAIVFTMPVVIWNAQHQWASLQHVAAQTGTNATGGWARGNLLEFVGAQIAIINPAIAVLMVGAVAYTLGYWSRGDSHRREISCLVCLGLPFLGICVVDSLRAKVQPNWPAPAYFTLLILTAYFVSTRMETLQRWRPWRGWFYGAVFFGLIIQPVVRGSTLLYPLGGWINRNFPRNNADRPRVSPSGFDVVFKLRGIADPFAATVTDELKHLPAGSFILCEDYQDASQLAFYVAGQPATYFVGSYWSDPLVRRRRTQFDMWPDRQLDRPELIGKDAVYIGTMAYAPLRESFAEVEQLPDIIVERNGMKIRSFEMWRCRGFLGIHRPDEQGTY